MIPPGSDEQDPTSPGIGIPKLVEPQLQGPGRRRMSQNWFRSGPILHPTVRSLVSLPDLFQERELLGMRVIFETSPLRAERVAAPGTHRKAAGNPIMSKTIRKRRDFESRARARKNGIRKPWREIPDDNDWDDESREDLSDSARIAPAFVEPRRHRGSAESGPARR